MRHLADGCKMDADTEFDADKSATHTSALERAEPNSTQVVLRRLIRSGLCFRRSEPPTILKHIGQEIKSNSKVPPASEVPYLIRRTVFGAERRVK